MQVTSCCLKLLLQVKPQTRLTQVAVELGAATQSDGALQCLPVAQGGQLPPQSTSVLLQRLVEIEEGDSVLDTSKSKSLGGQWSVTLG